MTARTRIPGEFCWINMLTPDPDRARAFYTALLGWTYVEMPGMGHRIRVAGHDVGAIFDLASPNTPPGTPPLIGVMVKVMNADAMVERVRALGGKAEAPFDVGPPGRMAVCHDPNGANFDLWQPGTSQGMEAEGTERGAPSWFETLTTDTARAGTFYSALFGWTGETMPIPGGVYTSFKLGETWVAGMMAIRPDMGPIPPHWGTYFTVTDVDATAKQAVALGAKLLVPTMEVAGVGRFCSIESPQGVAFWVITYAR